jgi:hypothetical protein
MALCTQYVVIQINTQPKYELTDKREGQLLFRALLASTGEGTCSCLLRHCGRLLFPAECAGLLSVRSMFFLGFLEF